MDLQALLRAFLRDRGVSPVRNSMKKVISVRFKENGKSYYFDPAGADIKTGEYVIVETARGIECGEVVQGVKEIADAAVPKALKPITRMADSVDIRRMRQNREDEKRAYRTCQECIARHGLEMKLVDAEYTLDRSKIMFYFTADGQNYHCDIDNLDTNASYRVTISYDSSRYYLYGLMKVEGIG